MTSCPVWGITGPIGSGKSSLGMELERVGGLNLEVDAIGHEVLLRPAIAAAVANAFGPAVLGPDGSILRKELGKRVFAETAALQCLNGIMHPPMIAEVDRLIAAERPRRRLIALNAALLYQMGLDSRCDLVLYVRAPAGIRLDRIVTHRGLPVERARLRLMAQDPEPQGDARVVFFDNDGSLAGMRQWVAEHLVPRLNSDWHSPPGLG